MTLKDNIFSDTTQLLERNGFNIDQIDRERPWGGFFVVAESDAHRFIDYFFPGLPKTALQAGKMSPKILLVEPGKKLSWQYHHRRAEIWRLIEGEAGIIRSNTDDETELYPLALGETIELQQGERHRLVGLQEWGVIAEIWMHTDASNPSDENDIVRVQDDFGRGTP